MSDEKKEVKEELPKKEKKKLEKLTEENERLKAESDYWKNEYS